jgi:hypothetical protein
VGTPWETATSTEASAVAATPLTCDTGSDEATMLITPLQARELIHALLARAGDDS